MSQRFVRACTMQLGASIGFFRHVGLPTSSDPTSETRGIRSAAFLALEFAAHRGSQFGFIDPFDDHPTSAPARPGARRKPNDLSPS